MRSRQDGQHSILLLLNRAHDEVCKIDNHGKLSLRSRSAGVENMIDVKDSAGNSVFTVDNSGAAAFRHNFYDSTQNAQIGSSIVVQDRSAYVGSSRISFARASHTLEMHRLKMNHVPIYLAGRGFTSNDLPSTHAINDMSVRDWIVHARDHFDEELHVHDVFPTANADWDLIDAPVPTLQAWANGADADINTLEAEIDQAQTDIHAVEADMAQAQTDIAAKQSQLSTTQLAICNKSLGTVASNSARSISPLPSLSSTRKISRASCRDKSTSTAFKRPRRNSSALTLLSAFLSISLNTAVSVMWCASSAPSS